MAVRPLVVAWIFLGPWFSAVGAPVPAFQAIPLPNHEISCQRDGDEIAAIISAMICGGRLSSRSLVLQVVLSLACLPKPSSGRKIPRIPRGCPSHLHQLAEKKLGSPQGRNFRTFGLSWCCLVLFGVIWSKKIKLIFSESLFHMSSRRNAPKTFSRALVRISPHKFFTFACPLPIISVKSTPRW